MVLLVYFYLIMFDGNSEEWMQNLYGHYNRSNTRLNFIANSHRQVGSTDELGLTTSNSNYLISHSTHKKSITIGEMITDRKKLDILLRSRCADLPRAPRFPLRARDSCKTLGKDSDCSENPKRKRFVSYKSSVDLTTGYQRPKPTQCEINPLFFKKINETVQNSKNLINSTRKFSNKVRMLTIKPTLSKINKFDLLNIEKKINLIK